MSILIINSLNNSKDNSKKHSKIIQLLQNILFFLQRLQPNLSYKSQQLSITIYMSDNFTKFQIEELQKEFGKYDENGDNSMNTKQLGEVMRSLGQNPTQYQIQMLIKQIDTDGNGTIDFGEFLSLMGRKMKNIQNEQQLKQVFKHFDSDADGMITAVDLKRILRRQHEGIDEERLGSMVEYMIQEVDIDDDGKINFQQFVTIMMAL